MADATTFEEAKMCPRCNLPGEDASQVPVEPSGRIRPGTVAHMIFCRNKDCKWFNTNWVVQVNPDGSIPPPQNHRAGVDKKYDLLVPDEVGKRVVDNLAAQLARETEPEAEIRRPGGR